MYHRIFKTRSSLYTKMTDYKGKSVSAKFNPKNEVVIYNGIVYESPSGAGTKVKIDLGAQKTKRLKKKEPQLMKVEARMS